MKSSKLSPELRKSRRDSILEGRENRWVSHPFQPRGKAYPRQSERQAARYHHRII